MRFPLFLILLPSLLAHTSSADDHIYPAPAHHKHHPRASTTYPTRTWNESYALANGLVSQMTMDEKLGLIIGRGQLNPARQCVGDTTPIPRFSIPFICMEDGPAGLRLVKNVTGFPAGLNVAATFSRRLMRERGIAMGEEWRGKGAHVLLGPAMDLMRNPKAGRAWEGFGPDPYLSGEAAYHTVLGIQSTGVQACAKHFAAYNQEHWRYGLSSDFPYQNGLGERTLREMYWYPFLRSIEAGVASVMCAYNQFNGTSSCHNAELLGPDGLLRTNGFQGYVVSDWGATHDSASDNANAGLDMEQPGDWIVIGGGVFSLGLESAVNSGEVTMERLNQMVERILAPWFYLGQDQDFPVTSFDAQKPDGSGPRNFPVNVRSQEHTDLVREIGCASSVLLKNNGTRGLPLTRGTVHGRNATVAVVGLDAQMPNQNCGQLNECNDGTMSVGWGSGSNSLDFIVPPIDALTSYLGGTANITASLSNDVDQGVSAAKGKDVAFVFVNAMSGELGFYDIVDGNMGDRNDLSLWFNGDSLIEGVAAINNNTIVIVHSVGPVLMTWADHPNITAIVYAGTPGEQTGPAIVDVLYGVCEPTGRLPFSIADNEAAYGTSIVYLSDGFPDIDYTENLFLDYRYMDAKGISPRFEFGFGLSYTTFAYKALSISPSSAGDGGYTLSFTVTNTGAVPGTEKPQVYLGYPPSAGEPEKVLRGFEEVQLGVGESNNVAITLSGRDMSIWDTPSQGYLRPSGTFSIFVGASIKDIRLTGTIVV